MPGSTYSTNLKIELMTTGENSGTWGDITNTNLGTAFEQAVIGLGNPDYTSDANLTITITNSNASQAARCLVLNVTSVFGSLTATRELIVPTIQKQYIVQNNTTGGQSITVKTSAGTGITVTNGRKAHLYVDGTNVIQMFDFVDINGGAIDGTPIGASSASTGAFTTLGATGNVTLGDADTDTITQAASYVTGTQLKSAKTATNTLSLAAYDVDGTAYTNLITLTASNTPTLALTSTGVGTINNMSIGATTASTGAFTTLSATGNATLSGATAEIQFTGATYGWLRATVGDLYIDAPSTKSIFLRNAGTTIGTVSSTGLAVTGTFSSTLGATIQGLTVGLGAGAVATNTAVGDSALSGGSQTGDTSTAVGYQAGYSNTTGSRNTFSGAYSGYYNTTGSYNTAYGRSAYGALAGSATGSYNVAIGDSALQSNTTASYNTALGNQAGYSNQTGAQVSYIGHQSGYWQTGSLNVSLGSLALYGASGTSTGANNVAIGAGSLFSNTSASNNTAVGYQAGYTNTAGAGLTVMGYQAGYFQTAGNTAIGYQSMYGSATTGGYNNTAVGQQSAYSMKGGTFNVAIGQAALYSSTAESNNTAVGYQAGYTIAGYNNTAIGYNAGSNGTSGTSSGNWNTSVGDSALNTIQTGGFNTAIGGRSLYRVSSGTYNVAVGYQSGNTIATTSGAAFVGAFAGLYATGSDNTAVGYGALGAITNPSTGSSNTAVGNSSLISNTSGANNTAVGHSALSNHLTGANNNAFGYQAGNNATTSSYSVFIGARTASNGASRITGSLNTMVGEAAGYILEGAASNNTFVGQGSGSSVTTGSKNSILGMYNGNQGGLNITSASNYIVLSDGDGNPLIATYPGASVSLKGAVPQTGTGITFPALQLASSNANTLDDYEEGLWTPFIQNSSGTESLAFTDAGYYTKIGNVVLLQMQIYNGVMSVIGAGNHIFIRNIPFSASYTVACAVFNTYPAAPVHIVDGSGTSMPLYLSSNAVDFTAFTRNGWGGSANLTLRGQWMIYV